WGRLLDQAIWVVAESLMLLIVIAQSLKSIMNFATNAAELQLTNERIGQAVSERTRELEKSREHYRLIAETTRAIPFELDLTEGRFTYIGPQAETVLGVPETRW